MRALSAKCKEWTLMCVSIIQLEQSGVYLYALKDYEFLLWIVDEEQCFLELLKTSSDEKF